MESERIKDTVTPIPEQSAENTYSGPPKWRSSRFILAYIMMLGNATIFFQRVSFSMVIVCMVNHTALLVQEAQTELNKPSNSSYELALSPLHNHVPWEGNSSVNRTLENTILRSSSSYAVSAILGSTVSSTVLNEDVKGIDYIITSGKAYSENPQFAYRNGSSSETAAGAGGDRCVKSLDEVKNAEKREDGPFVWDKETQGLLLGAVYWGYMATQVIAGYFFYFFGPRLVCGVSILIMSVLTMLCHPAALWSPWAVFALRVGVGLCTSFAIPSLFAMWGKWAPSHERATLVSLSFSGQNIANATVFPTAALLCKYGFAGGWPSVFYVFGLFGVVWCIVWFVLVTDSPESLHNIHPAEKAYIIAGRGSAFTKGQKIAVPWRQIFTSMCFWAIAAANFAFTWGLFLFLSNLPLFMHDVMNFDIKSNGAYSMMPYIALGCIQVISGFLSDFIVRRKFLGLFWARRLFCCLSSLVPAVCLLAMSYLDCTQVALVMSLLVTAVGFAGFGFSGFLVNPFDIAPRYAVSISSVTNSLACIPGILTPYVVAEVTKNGTREEWQIVFFITIGVFVVGTVFFCVFAKTSLQSWAVPASDITEMEKMTVNGQNRRSNEKLEQNAEQKALCVKLLPSDDNKLLSTKDNIETA